MDAETREALEEVRKGIAEPHRANNRHEYSEALAALSRIEQTLRDLSERLQGAASKEVALAERLERAEHLLEMEAIRASQWEEAALAAERERDEARKERSDAVTTAARAMERSAALAERVESFIEAGHGIDHDLFEMVCAERDALAERVERAERERDEALSPGAEWQQVVRQCADDRDAAEAEAARLREAILSYLTEHGNSTRLRAALSPPTDGEAT